MNETWAKQVENFKRAAATLEQEFVARKQTLFAKLAELMGVAAAPATPAKRKPGRPPKGAAPIAKPAAAARPGRKARGETTLPDRIVKVLRGAKRPMNAREILAGLQKVGWQTTSAEPQLMVYKTLHRIEKTGAVVKADRGKFVAPK